MISVHTNVTSLSTQRILGNTSANMAKNLEALSSGFRVNSAADDAAGLALATDLDSQTRSLDVAQRNVADGVSFVQVAEAGLGQMSDAMLRMKELATQGANGTTSDEQRALIAREFVALQEEVNRIAADTTFNGQGLLSAAATVNIQTGTSANAQFSIKVLRGKSSSISTWTTGALSLSNITSGDATASTVAAAGFIATLTAIDDALADVASARAQLGSYESRLGRISDEIGVRSENLQGARGRIMDTDIASEMASFTKNQILSQSGTSMLAQANAVPQSALSLLG